MFSSSKPFTPVSDRRKYDKLIIKDSNDEFTYPPLLLQSWFIIMIEIMPAPAPTVTEFETHRTSNVGNGSVEFNVYHVALHHHHTSNTSKYPKWLAKKSFRTQQSTPNDDCVVWTASFETLICQSFHVLITYELIVFL